MSVHSIWLPQLIVRVNAFPFRKVRGLHRGFFAEPGTYFGIFIYFLFNKCYLIWSLHEFVKEKVIYQHLQLIFGDTNLTHFLKRLIVLSLLG